jgi:UDP-N-acetylmuramate--alanine ligase
MDEFARSFMQADRLYVLDIYAASEKPIEGVTAQALVERIRQFGHHSAEYAGTIDRAVEAVIAGVEPGDAVLTLGAGNVWQAGDRVLARLKAEPAKRGDGKK